MFGGCAPQKVLAVRWIPGSAQAGLAIQATQKKSTTTFGTAGEVHPVAHLFDLDSP